MDAIECIKTRRSIRRFNNKKISDDKFATLINSAMMAPSGCHAQPWYFVVIKNKNIIKKLREAVIENNPNPAFFNKFCTYHNAPYLIAVCINLDKRWYHRKDPITVKNIDDFLDCPDFFSVAAAVQNLLLAANSLNIGACWGNTNSSYRHTQEKILGIKPPLYLAAVIAVGDYDETPMTPERKKLEDISRFIN